MRKNEFYQISKLKPKKIYIRAGEQIFEDKMSHIMKKPIRVMHMQKPTANLVIAVLNLSMRQNVFVLILLDIVCLGMRIKDI